MNILITGANGFIGKNLISTLVNIGDGKERAKTLLSPLVLFKYDIDAYPALSDDFCYKIDFVFNLAGVNRPLSDDEFMTRSFNFASMLLDALKKHNNTCPAMLSSLIQAELNNPYGQSKMAVEKLYFQYAAATGAEVLVYRFPNVFGKCCRPRYNSAVSTFCNNIARGLPIKINDPNVVMNLVYIDDVVDELLHALSGSPTRNRKFCVVPITYTVKPCEIVELIQSFKTSRDEHSVPDTADAFSKKLYLPTDQASYPLRMNCDARGSFP